MTAADQQNTNKQPAPIALFRQQLEQRLGQFEEALPPQITIKHFKSVVISAVMHNPDLLGADRVSLFESALAAANDGLLPDKREGAMVIYNTKIKDNGKEIWIKKVQWMPMVRGILNKVYNTGKVKAASFGVAYKGDTFRAWTDDEGDHLIYEAGDEQDRNVVRRIFAMVAMLNGGVFVETLTVGDVDKIRSKSKNKDSGPWVDWWDEMAIKSAIRRLAKRLPISREIMPILERDDHLYDLDLRANVAGGSQPRSLAGRLDALAGIEHKPSMAMDIGGSTAADEAYVSSEDQAQDKKKSASTRKHAKNTPDADSSSGNRQEDERAPEIDGTSESGAHQSSQEQRTLTPFEEGQKARASGMARKAVPSQFRNDEKLLAEYLDGFDTGARESGED